MLHLLTATGARPACWAICETLMAVQDYPGAVVWIIADDGQRAQPVQFQRPGWTLELVRPEPFWQPGQNTQARNLAAGLARVPDGAKLLIIEDDDWYAPDWLRACDAALESAELVGEAKARYYNVALMRGRQLVNQSHSSLCSTALRGGAITALRSACAERRRFIDMDLWRRHLSRTLFSGHRVVGIKGLPGRPGIGIGHSAAFRGEPDPDGALLRAWVGNDAEYYL